VDLGSKDLVEEVRASSKRADDAKSAMSFIFPLQQHTKKREREEKKRLLFGPAFPEFPHLSGRAVVREQWN